MAFLYVVFVPRQLRRLVVELKVRRQILTLELLDQLLIDWLVPLGLPLWQRILSHATTVEVLSLRSTCHASRCTVRSLLLVIKIIRLSLVADRRLVLMIKLLLLLMRIKVLLLAAVSRLRMLLTV